MYKTNKTPDENQNNKQTYSPQVIKLRDKVLDGFFWIRDHMYYQMHGQYPPLDDDGKEEYVFWA